MVRDSLGNKMPAGAFVSAQTARCLFLLTHCRTPRNFVAFMVVLIRPSQDKNKTPKRVFIFFWRMVRDSNPRWSCPHNGFQDRRIRPLCQPSETVFRRSFNLRFWCSHDAVMFALHFADARSQDTHASPRSANHPKLRTVCIVYYFFLQCKYKNSDV